MDAATFVVMIATYWVGGSAANEEYVAAHRTLPFGTILNVCLRRKCVGVVVKDRGPFPPKMDLERRIDLSYAAAPGSRYVTRWTAAGASERSYSKPRPQITVAND
jgi:rare lipoprotein A (peptidoglycan hydrolase)